MSNFSVADESQRKDIVENMVKTIEAALPEYAEPAVVALAAAMVLNRMCIGRNQTVRISFTPTTSGVFEE